MLLNLQRQNYNTRACSIRNVSYKFGFGVVWEMQGVEDVKSFIKEIERRLVDCFKRDWLSALESHDFCNVYSNFNHSLVRSPYISLLNNISVRTVFAGFRTGMSALKFRYLQYRPVIHNKGIDCPFCNDTPKVEVHFLLTCQKYKALRDELIPSKYYRQPSMFKFFLLLACCNESIIQKLSIFVFKALTIRRQSFSVSMTL